MGEKRTLLIECENTNVYFLFEGDGRAQEKMIMTELCKAAVEKYRDIAGKTNIKAMEMNTNLITIE
ncbi:hypothetical protein V6615_10970 [Oscillospiraceae bacterium PP1C4]